MRKFYLLLLLIFVIGCQKANFDQDTKPQNEQNIVNKQQAEQLLAKVGELSITKSGIDAPYAVIASMTTVKDEAGNPVYHVVNYNTGGFVILAADDRIVPVLAYSQTGEFDLNGDINPGLAGWMKDEKEQVKYVRATNALQSDVVAAQWEPEAISRTLGAIGIPDQSADPNEGAAPEPCYCSRTMIGPLLPSDMKWYQGSPYNNNTPMKKDNSGNYVHAPVGCVALAVGQVMAYHKYPREYISTPDISSMLADVGGFLNTVYKYNESSAHEATIPAVLKNRYGYQRADYAKYNYETVISNLYERKPVILSGCNVGGGDGHSWVCDGFDKQTFCPDHSYRGYGYSTIHLSMKWGWGGKKNGHYAFNNWAPNGSDFNYYRTMIYNITKR